MLVIVLLLCSKVIWTSRHTLFLFPLNSLASGISEMFGPHGRDQFSGPVQRWSFGSTVCLQMLMHKLSSPGYFKYQTKHYWSPMGNSLFLCHPRGKSHSDTTTCGTDDGSVILLEDTSGYKCTCWHRGFNHDALSNPQVCHGTESVQVLISKHPPISTSFHWTAAKFIWNKNLHTLGPQNAASTSCLTHLHLQNQLLHTAHDYVLERYSIV